MIRYVAALLLAAWAVTAHAQLNNPGMSAAQVAAALPVPSDTVPGAETIGGAAGSVATYRRGDAVQPRITRAANCTLDSNGACSVTWATALASAPTIVATPVNPTAAQAVMCNTTATPTTTTVSIKCWTVQTTVLSLAVVTAGITLVPAVTAPSGTVVQIIAIPNTQ